jgi:hypoxanthine phosphoribosyltransferase
MQPEGGWRIPVFRTIVNEARIRSAVRRLAAAIERDYGPQEPLVVVAVLKGALVFLADLIRRLPMPVEVELVAARSYCGTRREARVELLDDVRRLDLRGKRVLLVDCVLDSGHTLRALQEAVEAEAPASLESCVLLRKARPGRPPVEPKYVGAEIPDVFVVGYGLDLGNRWRHLPYVAELPAELAGPPPHAESTGPP